MLGELLCKDCCCVVYDFLSVDQLYELFLSMDLSQGEKEDIKKSLIKNIKGEFRKIFSSFIFLLNDEKIINNLDIYMSIIRDHSNMNLHEHYEFLFDNMMEYIKNLDNDYWNHKLFLDIYTIIFDMKQKTKQEYFSKRNDMDVLSNKYIFTKTFYREIRYFNF
jgi:hypothetical protein